MKRIVSLLTALVIATAMLTLVGCKEKPEQPPADDGAPTEETVVLSPDTSLKPVDVYIIAGQSNAAGTSKITGGMDGRDAENTELTKEVFNSVLYGGVSQPRIDGGYATGAPTYFKNSFVSRGYGVDYNYIGPEYGMAKELSKHYTAESPALIFKYAAGGTPLRNINADKNDAAYGNWYPISLCDDAKESGDEIKNITGALSNGLVEAFARYAESMAKEGLRPVVKGIAWMQGEDDRGYEDEYRDLLRILISDFKRELTTITQVDCSGAVFANGEVSETFASSSALGINKRFNQMQHDIACASELSPCAVVETGDLDMHDRETGDCIGSDSYHWSARDMITLGERFGRAMLSAPTGLTASVKATQIVDAAEFTLDKTEFASGESVTLSVKTDKSVFLRSVKLNGQAIALDKDGRFVAESLTENALFELELKEKELFTMEIEGAFSALKSSSFVYEGDTAFVVPIVGSGKVVDWVTYNGEKMTYNEELKRYEHAGVTENGKIVIKLRGENEPATEPSKDGCSKESVSLLLTALGALALAAAVLKK